jgi:hypothetical protein
MGGGVVGEWWGTENWELGTGNLEGGGWMGGGCFVSYEGSVASLPSIPLVLDALVDL